LLVKGNNGATEGRIMNRKYTFFLPEGTCFSVLNAEDAFHAKQIELAYCGVRSQASIMRYADTVQTFKAINAALLKSRRMYGNRQVTLDTAVNADELLTALNHIQPENREMALNGRGGAAWVKMLREAADLMGASYADETMTKRQAIAAILESF
jgi:hypothetical protein